MSDTRIFETERVSFAYRAGPPVLSDIDLTIQPGRFYGIVGPNGSGKTTLIDILTGNRHPTSGRACLLGRPIDAYTRRELARLVALVPQEFQIGFPYTVGEVVMMGRHPYLPRFSRPLQEDLGRVDSALETIGLLSLKDRLVTDLSGGEKQRVVLARALVQDTRVLVLDEPTSSLDVRHALHVLGVIRAKVDEEGRTAVAVMHDLNLAAAFCHELVFLKQGRIRSSGKTEDVLRPEVIQSVFNVQARTRYDEFAEAHTVVFKRSQRDA